MAERNMVRLVVKVTPEQKMALDALAEREDRTLSSALRRVIDESTVLHGPTIRLSSSIPLGPPVQLPVGGQDAAAGREVEERRDAQVTPLRPEVGLCSSGRHPKERKVGRACEACGDKRAWAE